MISLAAARGAVFSFSPGGHHTQHLRRQGKAASRPARLGRLALVLTAALVLPVATGAPGAAAAPGPPPVTVLTPAAHLGNGDIFVTPTSSRSKYANGPEILDTRGNAVWFHAIPVTQTAADFRAQRYGRSQVLTWWQGTGFGGLSCGTDHIYSDQFQQIATVQAGNGLCADGHEFLITPQNTALITIYQKATANLTAIGGPANQTVINGVVQEIDIATGQVLLQWNSAGHIPYSQSEQPLPAKPSEPWDWFHLNAVKVDTDGNLLIGARHTWATYKVDHLTGDVLWSLGGKASSFTLAAAPGQMLDQAGELFAWQHDPQPLGNDAYTFFDNEANGATPPLLPDSRAITVQLNQTTHVATLAAADNQPEGLLAPFAGNAQTTGDGNLFVGWGALPYFSAFDPTGTLIFNARFPLGVYSYRAYFLPFNPAT
jgi:hypothetical protein